MPNRVDPIAFPPGLDTTFQGVAGRLMAGLVERGVVSDETPGSVARTLVETFAREVATFYEVLSRAHAAGYLETADGEALDQVVALLGLTRARAGRLAGQVSFSRLTPADAAIAIPAGLRVTGRTPDGRPLPVFEVSADTELPKGGRSVLVEVAEAPDQDTRAVPNLEAGSLTILPRPLLGVESVSNPRPITRAGVDESDEALRARARVALRVGERSTAEALEAAAREAGAQQVSVEEPAGGAPGRVIVRVADPDFAGDRARVERVRAALDRARAAGVRVELDLLRAVRFQPVLEITLEDPALPEAEERRISAAVSAALVSALAALPPGKPVLRRKVEGAALSVSGVSAARLLAETTTRPLDDEGEPGVPDGDARLLADGSAWQIREGERAILEPERSPPVIRVQRPPVALLSLTARTSPNALSAETWRGTVRAALAEAYAALPVSGADRAWTLSSLVSLLGARAFVVEIRALRLRVGEELTVREAGDDRPFALAEGAVLDFGELIAVTGAGA